MTNNEKDIVEGLRLAGDSLYDNAADLIESLSAELKLIEAVAAEARGLECERDQLLAELEQVERERDGLSIMLTSATSAAETYKCERDAAVEDLRSETYFCETCANYTPGYFCLGCRNKSNWQWRGPGGTKK